jgi:glutamate dehydrogenase/leucine dehydrogenase
MHRYVCGLILQGLGNVGSALVGYLLEAGVAKIIGSDISEAKISHLLTTHAADKERLSLRVESQDTPYASSILSEQCDVFSPCGFGGILNEDSVPHIKAKVICGAANNQLLDSRLEYGMQKQGIVYVPDFVCNRMGIVNCANEQYGSIGEMGSTKDPITSRHLNKDWDHSVFQVTDKVIRMAHDRGISTNEAAELLADVFAEEEHPIWGHRSKDIIQSLTEDGWAC